MAGLVLAAILGLITYLSDNVTIRFGDSRPGASVVKPTITLDAPADGEAVLDGGPFDMSGTVKNCRTGRWYGRSTPTRVPIACTQT